LLSGCPEQLPDPNFPTKVANPANPGNRPKALFDEAHNDVHSMRDGYQAFAALMNLNPAVWPRAATVPRLPQQVPAAAQVTFWVTTAFHARVAGSVRLPGYGRGNRRI
jgi:hypothetical protein